MVSSAFRLDPSNLNCTPTTPILSEAVAETVTEDPETVAPPTGVLIETVGAVVSDGGGVPVPDVLMRTKTFLNIY